MIQIKIKNDANQSNNQCLREAFKIKTVAQIWVFSKRGGEGFWPNQKFWGTFFLPQNRQKGSEQIQKFWGSFEVVLGQFWGKIIVI